MKREIKQFQRPAGPRNPRVTEHQAAQSVIVNLRHASEVDDDVHSPSLRQRDYRSTQGRFRIAYCDWSRQMENPDPFFFSWTELELLGGW
jgi:hypothetical protein